MWQRLMWSSLPAIIVPEREAEHYKFVIYGGGFYGFILPPGRNGRPDKGDSK